MTTKTNKTTNKTTGKTTNKTTGKTTNKTTGKAKQSAEALKQPGDVIQYASIRDKKANQEMPQDEWDRKVEKDMMRSMECETLGRTLNSIDFLQVIFEVAPQFLANQQAQKIEFKTENNFVLSFGFEETAKAKVKATKKTQVTPFDDPARVDYELNPIQFADMQETEEKALNKQTFKSEALGMSFTGQQLADMLREVTPQLLGNDETRMCILHNGYCVVFGKMDKGTEQ